MTLAKRIARKNLAFVHADDQHLGRFFYGVTLTAFGSVPADLSLAEVTLLTAWAVLSRAGELGFIGTKASAGAVCAFVGRVVPRARMGRSTYFNTLAGLVAKGYAVRSTYGGGRPRLVYEARNPDECDVWKRDQRTVVTFTERALALWSCPTLAPVSIPVQKLVTDKFPRVLDKNQETPARARVDVGESSALQGAVKVSPVATLEIVRSPALAQAERPKGQARKARARGTGGGGPSRPSTRAAMVRAILACVVFCTAKKGRVGKAACARAALELADPRLWATSAVAWDHWFAAWGRMTQAEQRRAVRAEIIPVLVDCSPPPVVLADIVPPLVRGCVPPLVSMPCGSADPAVEPPPRASSTAADLVATMTAAAAAGNAFAVRWLADHGVEP